MEHGHLIETRLFIIQCIIPNVVALVIKSALLNCTLMKWADNMK